MNAPRVLTIVLPFAPEEKEAHDRLVAAACALHAQGGWPSLQLLQLSPPGAAVQPCAAGDALHWWNVVHPHADVKADAETLARVAAAALATPALASQESRLIVWPAGALTEEAAALLGADIGAAVLGRCSSFAIDGDGVQARRAAFGGRLDVDLRSTSALCCAVWRPQGEVPALGAVDAARVHLLEVEVAPCTEPVVEVLHEADGQARLEGARLVVSGGRGMAGPEGFMLLSRVAAALGAALGGSLPAVDAGWVPVARQVGQSGRFVSPRLYVAVGISGTPQHLAGIATGTRIIAVNSDPEAPIFSVAEVGVVADWQQLLPALAQRLESARG
jgi:electron transfer flavoprotein alpha subunit